MVTIIMIIGVIIIALTLLAAQDPWLPYHPPPHSGPLRAKS